MKKYNIIKKILKFFNLNISRYHKNFDEIISILVKNKKPIIFDVGANKGQSIDRFNSIFNHCEIHSFEPLPKLISFLKQKYNHKDIYIIDCALSDKIENKKIYSNNIGNYGAMASFYKLKNNSKFKNDYQTKNSKIGKKNYQSKELTSEVFNIITNTLDNYVEKNNIKIIDVLKIDTQGFESEVLIGSINSLNKKIIKNIELELILNDGYEKNFYFHSFDKILSEAGYKMIALSNHGNLIDSPGLNIDLLYTCSSDIV